MWPWHFTMAQAPQVMSMSSKLLRYSCCGAWETPRSGCLLLGVCKGESGHCLALSLGDSSTDGILVPLPPQEVAMWKWSAVWGTCLALLPHSTYSAGRGCDQLQLYDYHAGQLMLRQVVTLGQRRFCGTMKLSPDGELVVSLTYQPQGRGSREDKRLAIVRLQSGRVCELALPQDEYWLPPEVENPGDGCVGHLRWTPDGGAVVLSRVTGPSWIFRLDM